jgi:hypothetical protein
MFGCHHFVITDNTCSVLITPCDLKAFWGTAGAVSFVYWPSTVKHSSVLASAPHGYAKV